MQRKKIYVMNMKKFLLVVATVLTTVFSASAAQGTGITLDADLKAALPSGEYFLPAPPEVGSLIWKDDSTKYFQYKELGRRYDEEKQEYWDSVWAKMNEQYYFALYRLAADSVMNVPFITNLSWTKNQTSGKYTVSYTRNNTDFPQMNRLELMCEEMKEQGTSNLWRTRPRPYCYFGDWYSGNYYAAGTSNASSYPSGHGYFAGLFGMCMMYIDPDNSLAIKKMIDEWCDCRLILGAHWKTDLDAGKQLGAIAFSIAMNYDQFHDQVEAAKAELEAYRAAHPSYIREHQHKQLNTFCYPYQVDSYTGATFYTMLYKEVDGDGNPVNIYLQEHEGPLVAGKPYFYVPNANSKLLVCWYSGVETAAGNDGNGVYGVYENETPVASGMYVTYNGNFVPAGSNVKLAEYRAYVYMDEVSTNPQGPAYIPGRNLLRIGSSAEVPTDIDVVQIRRKQNTKELNNGQLIIITEGKTYNAVGQEIR